MRKVIKVGEKDVTFTATAATPMKYRNAFPGKDLFRDLIAIDEAREEAVDDPFGGVDMEVFERIAYIMSDAYSKGVSQEDWLSQFELMDIVMALPELIDLWGDNAQTQSLTEKNGEATER